eukprot:Lithocolla_globosa_v1_NODE_204_length_5187_cov_37.604053.p4 type:complete len:123 gc:universal NODE_204_length_5187_cov_37.604053:1268-900(-)
MHDKLPNLPSDPKKLYGMIINLDKSDNPGTHWVAGFKRGKQAYYYDSFGVQPDDRTIKALRNPGDPPIKYNTGMHQKIESNRCGYFVKKWLTNMFERTSFYDSLYRNMTQIPSNHNERTVHV